ncbi:MAG: YitT family protein [Atopobiaceae bacterium]|jgi:uncharacterized membrane-anchored protein YitT (DUF2179 family)|nr:YitT family protein [Atopobiaceae bacterium]MCH4215068.1 YitT family protein [Atopobiaceae bacterium]MCH4230620.1 YitT family protein [Atopobiaceae bacterium]MCH4276781.1 YitT family protein [Atopobiaceae bacterium]MCI1227233.1 YitT family protein [Atopobiaceae bacterium]
MEQGRSRRGVLRDAILICVGSFVFAVGIDCFQVPNGLAAGGVTGLATVIRAAVAPSGIDLPIGLQTLAMNALLMIPVIRSGGLRYATRTLAGIIASAVFTDALAPVLPVLGGGDLLLCALYGGLVSGFGLGLVFRSGGNTGGTDIIAQLLSKRTSAPVGTLSMVCDVVIVVISIPVFSLDNALYAAVCMFITGRLIDMVIDGPRTERAAWVISNEHERIANDVMYEMGRGCTEIQARGVWSGNDRPMLYVILSRGEIGMLKTIVSDIDPDAVVVISEVHEAFGEGFRQIGS